MEFNGFDSSKFRYFKLIREGNDYSLTSCVFPHLKENMIFKISEESLYASIFSENFYRKIEKHLEEFKVKRFSNEKEFNVTEFLSLQDKLIINEDYQTKFTYDTGHFCIIDPWFKSKMKDDDLYIGTWFSDPKSLKQRNQEVFNMIMEEEKILSEKVYQLAMNLCDNKQLTIENETEFYKFKVDTPIYFNFKKGEILDLTNPAIALALINQNLLKLFVCSEEIIGEEKENAFVKDVKDFVPGTLYKYYKVKDNITIEKINDLCRTFINNTFNCSYCSDLVGRYGRVDFCEYNNANYRDDGTIEYFYVEYHAGISDSIIENEILKIADCLPQEEAIIRYNMDIEAKKRRKLELEALEYVKNHKAKYYKGTNRLLTPVEFMLQEEAKERKSLGMRLVRTLNKRINDIQ